MFLLWFMPTTAPGMQLLGYNPILPPFFQRKSRLPIGVEFGLKRGNQMVPASKPTHVKQLKRRLRCAQKKAKEVARRQQARHKGLYDQRCRRLNW